MIHTYVVRVIENSIRVSRLGFKVEAQSDTVEESNLVNILVNMCTNPECACVYDRKRERK